MRVTTKGQVTIPQDMRERYALGPGTEVEFVPTDDGPLLRARGDRDQRGLAAQLRDKADSGLTADEVLRLTRGDRD